ncbi:MAG: hypothetical protein JNJ99_00850 [Crocinitomicaceae bacterium]|nr:hypothetical protein [Crocinitomicaceae bacterium]
MKKKLVSILTFMFVGLGINSTAQEIKIHNGAQFTVTSLESVETVLDASDNQTSFLTRAGFISNKFRVLNLDGQLNEKSKFEIEIPEVEGKKLKYFWATKIGNNVYFMSRYFDNKANTYYLFASELNPTTGNFNRHLEAVKVTDDKFRSFNNPFSATRSVDSLKVMFLTRYPTKNNENARYGMKVVNSDMSEVWSKDIEFPIEDKNFTMMDIEVDKDGNVHLVAQIRMTNDEKDDKDSRSRYYVNIYSYFWKTGELKQYEVGFQNELMREIELEVNANNELVGTGFYSEKKFMDSYKGFFYMRIDPTTKEVVAKSLSPFSTELLTEIIGERKAEKGKEMPAYVVRRVMPMSNGGISVVAEHYVYTKNTYTDANGNTHTSESWLFGNVLVMFLDSEGKMKTAAVIKKRQYCTARDGGATLWQQLGIGMTPGVNELPYYGISVMQNKDNIYVMYNENPKNAERAAAGKKLLSVRQKTSVTQLVTVTPDGKLNADVLFKSQDKEAGYKMPLMPRSSIQYSANEMIVFGRKGKTMRVSRLTID